MITPELQAALDDCAEQERLQRVLQRARAAESLAESQLADAKGRAHLEANDVAKLESLSPTRIWSALRGRWDTDFDRELAEAQEAEYRAASAQQALATAAANRQQALNQLAALGDPQDRKQKALAGEEARLRAAAGSAADQLLEIAQQLAAGSAQLTEIDQALAAEQRARHDLEAAAKHLEDASGWASFDTFLGGGMLTDMAKYSKMDEATARLRAADASLRHLSAELADVRMAKVDGLDVDALGQLFDVWFDNLFSDWSVLDRINRAGTQVSHALQTLAVVRERLQQRRAGVAHTQQTLAEAREQVLFTR